MSAASQDLIYRHLTGWVSLSLMDTPVVMVNGPRQCGKTTLVKQFAQGMASTVPEAPEQVPSEGMPYLTLDDPALLDAARNDPVGLIKQLDRAIIDEVQRAPQLLLALKQSVDQDRRPGRFLLTGSANLMALPQIADSLSGRVEIHTLLPLSQSELQGRASDFLQRAQEQNWPLTNSEWVTPAVNGESDTVLNALAGGYPEMRARLSAARRTAWARSYIRTLVERDVQDIAQIEHLDQIPRLLDVAAAHCGQLFNASQIGGQLSMDNRRVEKYLGILEKLFLVQRLPAWGRNELGRLIKTPKLHFLDAGLQATLMRLTPDMLIKHRDRWGSTLETWVYAELRKILAMNDEAWYLAHYRDKDQVEVDFVMESPLRQIIGIEAKAAATVGAQDFKGLRRLQSQTAKDFITGIVLYDGDKALSFGEGMWAVPLAAL
ncbi:ATP-binding protein [Acidovorax sp. LjRoot129]|uniref:ATP-binding protein n=1 Tax=unclassified Acidovorax TaxID=2684926 RepID=UPI003ED013E1